MIMDLLYTIIRIRSEEKLMQKLELLARIQKLASLVHCEDLAKYDLSEESLQELRSVLDKLTDEYIANYCETSY